MAYRIYDQAKGDYVYSSRRDGLNIASNVDKFANLHIGYNGVVSPENPHIWDDNRFTNLLSQEDNNLDAGIYSAATTSTIGSYRMFNTNWSFYKHPQWARIYAKSIGSKLKGTRESFFQSTKLLTINGNIIANFRNKNVDPFSVQGWEFLSMNEESITINDVSRSDGSPHEIDFLYNMFLFLSKPRSKMVGLC